MPDSLGLPRSRRLLTGAQFKRVFDQREAVANALFRIHHAPGDCPRLGQAVSRRVAPRAVDRNRIRRQVRESFRQAQARLPARDYVVLARPAAAKATGAELREAMNQLWQRLI